MSYLPFPGYGTSLIALIAKPLAVCLVLLNLTHVQSVGGERMNELVLNSAGKLKMCTMPLHHNEYFSVSLTGISNPTPFSVGCLLLNTHVCRPHTVTLRILCTSHTCEQTDCWWQPLASTATFLGPGSPEQRPENEGSTVVQS